MLSLLVSLLAAAPTPAPVDVAVPKELAAKSCTPELSGITWVPSISRYLAVSDDTGILDTASWHAPWLFTLDAEGHYDAAPRVIEGLESLDDGESITPGPPGTFFLTTSHTKNKKGNSKPARRQLLWLTLEGERLRVSGRFDLSTLALDQLITGRDDELDIEAIAFRDGALFVGHKAPLDATGRAAIVRIGDIAAVFKGAPAKPAVWSRPMLEVPDAEGTLVPEGVTDLLFLPGGRMVLAANAPKSGKPDGGGAVWRLDGPDAKPVLLHRFPGLKPEGLTLSPDGKQLVVVFDRGDQLPSQWVHLPLP